MRQITFDPYIPFALWWPLALATATLLVWYAVAARSRLPKQRWLGVIVLMGVAATIPLVVLLNPTWLEQIPPPAGKPLLTVLVDGSASMATRDAEGGVSRFERAVADASEIARQLSDRYDVRLRRFAADSSEFSPEALSQQQAEGASTDVAAAIEQAIDESRPQGQAMLVLSDGVHNAPGGAAGVRRSVAKAKAMDAPVYVHTIGQQTGVKDLDVSLNLPQELAFVGQRVPVVVALQQRGSLARQTTLSLLHDDEVIEQREVTLQPDSIVEETFHITQEESGLYRYQLRADPLAEEVTEVNNAATLLLRVVDEPVRVLLLEGKPYWDTKFLVRTLSTDWSIELVSVVRMAEGRLLERTISRGQADEDETPKDPAASDPAEGDEPEAGGSDLRVDRWEIRTDAAKVLGDAEALDSYQIVILGRDAEVFLTDEALLRLKRWLTEKDGSLICFRGAPASQISQRLGELMPVRWMPTSESRFRVQLTQAGQALRWLPAGGDDPLTALPSLAAVSRGERPKPLAVVLATAAAEGSGDPVPVITYQPVGNGRVVVVEGAGMWRWAFLPPEHQSHEQLYAVFWRSLTRWLVSNVGLFPSQQLALRTDKVTFSTGESVTATMLVSEDQLETEIPQVELSGTGIEQPQVFTPVPRGDDPGQFQVALGKLPEGRYRIEAVGSGDEQAGVAEFDVQGNLTERLDVRAQPNLMKQLAAGSGGTVLEQIDPDGLAGQFDEHLQRSRPERTMQTTAWDRWWLLVGAFGIWASAWAVRRRSGLV